MDEEVSAGKVIEATHQEGFEVGKAQTHFEETKLHFDPLHSHA